MLMPAKESFALAARPSRMQQRFELRYAEALGVWSRNGFRWEIGPVEPVPPDKHYFSRLVQHVEQGSGPWRWLYVSHEYAGPVGYLALFFEGNVRDEAGRGLSEPALLAWGTRELDLAGRRILHQNRINTALNARREAQARRELPWVRVACLVAGLSALLALGVTHALTQGWLRAENDSLRWLVGGFYFVAAMASLLLGLRWYQLRQWRGSERGS